MYWNLRIPLFLFVMGTISGLQQKFPVLFLVHTNYFIRNALFIGLIVGIFTIMEQTKINEKKVHFFIGILLICAAMRLIS
jgi:type III secretory pathway component EscS